MIIIPTYIGTATLHPNDMSVLVDEFVYNDHTDAHVHSCNHNNTVRCYNTVTLHTSGRQGFRVIIIFCFLALVK